LAYRQRGEDLIDQMRGRLDHAPCVAGRTYRAAFARKGNQKIVPARPAAGPGEAVGQNAALEVAAELPLHVRRHAVPISVPLAAERQVGLEVPLDRLVQRRALGAAAAIHGARGRRVDGSVHAAPAADP